MIGSTPFAFPPGIRLISFCWTSLIPTAVNPKRNAHNVSSYANLKVSRVIGVGLEAMPVPCPRVVPIFCFCSTISLMGRLYSDLAVLCLDWSLKTPQHCHPHPSVSPVKELHAAVLDVVL